MAKQKIDDVKREKPVTRYDEKMERRKLQAQKEARNDRILRLALIAVAVLVVGTITAAVATTVINRNKITKDTYITVGEHQITKLEYDYYYTMTVSNYLNMYSSILPYMGLDTSRDFADQPYSDTMTWADAFAEMAVAQIQQTKSAVDDAQVNAFAPDLTDAYNEFLTGVATAASTAGANEAQYYQSSFGPYATKANVEPFIKEQLMVEAYYDDLMEKNRPTDEEITEQYEANKQDYDKVSYHSFTFSADLAEDATEEQTEAAMTELAARADDMMSRREAGEDFKALCLEFAGEEDKATYEDAESDASFTENAGYLSVSTYYHDWLFDESRAAGDITVVADEDGHNYHVVEFVNRIYDETTNTTISDTVANQRVSEYLASLAEGYEVTDVAGDLVYLTIPQTTEAADDVTGDMTGDAAAESSDAAGTDADGTDAAETEADETGAETAETESSAGTSAETTAETTAAAE